MWAVNELYKNYHSQGLEIWGLNFDEKKDAADALLKDSHIEWPQYFDRPSGGTVQRQYGLYALPTVWLVDKRGVLRELKVERAPDALIKQLLAE
jgi:AhpC/TSA family